MVLHQTFPDFLLFLFVHLSRVDEQYDPKELAVIKNKMTQLFPVGTDLEQKLYTTLKQYNSFNPENLKSLFNHSFEHFKEQVTSSSHLLSDMQEIIGADGRIDPVEVKALDAFKQILENTYA
jgi:uncharacterized tellurite resistance protein B-like protein